MELILIVISFLSSIPVAAHAYLDPGTGSYLVQILLVGMISGAVMIKTFWRKMATAFSSLFSSKKEVSVPLDSDNREEAPTTVEK